MGQLGYIPLTKKDYLSRVPILFDRPHDPWELVKDPYEKRGGRRGFANGTFLCKYSTKNVVNAVGWTPESFYIEDAKAMRDAAKKKYPMSRLFEVTVKEVLEIA